MKDVLKYLKSAIKYGALVIVIIEVLEFAVNKLEGWINKDDNNSEAPTPKPAE
jgi:hypothetical protein